MARLKKPEMERGTGSTTKQIQDAPIGAVFVWCNAHVDYPKKLAKELGREDLKIVPRDWLDNRWRGLELTAIVVDHATKLSDRECELLSLARERIIPLGKGDV